MEINRWRQPPVAPAKENRAPEGRRTITDCDTKPVRSPLQGFREAGGQRPVAGATGSYPATLRVDVRQCALG